MKCVNIIKIKKNVSEYTANKYQNRNGYEKVLYSEKNVCSLLFIT